MRKLVLLAIAVPLAAVLGLLLVPRDQGPEPAELREPMAARVPPQVDPTGEPRREPAEPRRRGKPNLVYVIADDMRWDDLRFAPNVRRLVQEGGVSFENSFANYPLCCPARASYFTGQYAHNHGVLMHDPPYGFASFDDARTLATSLTRAGYSTGFVGKYLNGYGGQTSRVSGESSYDYVPAGWTDWYGALERPPGVDTPEGGTYDYFRGVYNINGTPSGTRFHGEYTTETVGRFGRELVGKYAGRDPFFLYLSFLAPHHGAPTEADDPAPVRRADGRWQDFPTAARPDWVKGRFDDVVRQAPGLTPAGEGEANIADMPGYLQIRPELNAAERAALLEVTRQRAEAIYVMDLQIGRLVQRLKQTGEWRDTILMFTSDNGYFLGEHRVRQGKTTAHEPSLRVPFLMAGPGIARGEQRFDPITTVDITATLLDLAGAADPPAAPDGVSLVPALREGDRGWDRPVLNEALLAFMKPGAPGFDERGSIGIRTSRWSLIRYANGVGELYDLRADPDQLRNLYRNPQYADIRAALTKVWWQVKDCEGAACRAAVLPPSLRATPEEAADDYRTWAAGVRSGNSHSPAR